MGLQIRSGFETGSASIESSATNGSPVINATAARSGGYGFDVKSLSSGATKAIGFQWRSTTANGIWMSSIYIKFITLPTAENSFLMITSGNAVSNITADEYITIDNTGILRLYINGGTQVGSTSSALQLNRWYQIDMKFDRSPAAGSQVAEARINRTVFATASNLTITNAVRLLAVGGNLKKETQTTGEWYIDDVALNDATGSFQNSYPGPRRIIHAPVNAAGDLNLWLKSGGGAGDTSNFNQLSEVTPDDITTYLKSTTLNDEDFYLCNIPSDIVADSPINLVAIGVRYASDNTISVPTFKVEAKKASGGTISQGNAITPVSTSFVTNANAIPFTYPLILYQTPDSLSWTAALLATMQIGMKLTVDNTNFVYISTLWALIEYQTNETDEINGGYAFGEQSPTNGELPISFQTFDNGAGSIPTITGDPDWGQISLSTGNEARSKVYDFSDTNLRQYTLVRDLYGSGTGSVNLFIRGSSTSFTQDNNTLTWNAYTAPIKQSWRYVQIRAVGV